jgi:hypothetical protein
VRSWQDRREGLDRQPPSRFLAPYGNAEVLTDAGDLGMQIGTPLIEIAAERAAAIVETRNLGAITAECFFVPALIATAACLRG